MGSIFSWNKSADENPAPGGETVSATSGSVASAAAAQARENALNLSGQTKRGRKPKSATDAGSSGNDSALLRARIEAEIGAQLEALHDPRAWGALLACPADVAVTLTGRKYWEVSGEERATLGACGSAVARTLMITNPKALAFLMLSGALFAVYGTRVMKEAEYQREQRKLKEKEKPDAGKPAQ